MIFAKNFFHHAGKETGNALQSGAPHRRDAQGRLHAALYSALFSESAHRPLWSNAMFKSLKNDIEDAIQFISTKEKVVLDIYETGVSTELDRERALIGFRKYMNENQRGTKKELASHLTTFTVFLLIGVAFILYLFAADTAWMPDWCFQLVNIIANVFIWQFVGYMAFQFPIERKALSRIRQILSVEYEFHHWD